MQHPDQLTGSPLEALTPTKVALQMTLTKAALPMAATEMTAPNRTPMKEMSVPRLTLDLAPALELADIPERQRNTLKEKGLLRIVPHPEQLPE